MVIKGKSAFKGLVSSRNEARRLIAQKAVRVNGTVLADPRERIHISRGDIIEVGKKKVFRVEWVLKSTE